MSYQNEDKTQLAIKKQIIYMVYVLIYTLNIYFDYTYCYILLKHIFLFEFIYFLVTGLIFYSHVLISHDHICY